VYNQSHKLDRTSKVEVHMNVTRVLVGAALAVVFTTVLAPPTLAHHSFAAEFDANKPVMLTGAVTKVEWANPHIWVYLDVRDEHGVVQPWQCEGGAPNTLTRNGWSKDSLKASEQITIDGWLAKNGTRTCNMRAVKMADGRTVFAGSSNGAAATPKQP
jgi:hypothetical protein